MTPRTPAGDGISPLLSPGLAETFDGPQDLEVTSSDPLTKAILTILADGLGLRITELTAMAARLLSDGGLDLADSPMAVDELLLGLHARGIIELCWRAPRPPQVVTAEPRWQAHPLARLEARLRSYLTSPRHRPVAIDRFTAYVLQHLDLPRGQEDILAALLRGIDSGELDVDVGGRPDEAQLIAWLETTLTVYAEDGIVQQVP